MTDFSIFFSMGVEHITDINGIDHILFILALCLRYMWSDWKKILVLITAFTIGHSITLALSTLNVVNFSRSWTEFFIAVTIIITALNNFWVKDFQFTTKFPLIYFFALFFGCIHGLGFSTLLKSMLGKDQSIVLQLFSFNLGLEAGQLIIVAGCLFLTHIFVSLLKIKRRSYVIIVSTAVLLAALQMAIERLPTKNKNDEKNSYLPVHVSTRYIS